MPDTTTGALTTDLDLMTAVAGRIDASNEDLRTMLGAFMGRMTTVPAAVWGGAAAVRFRDVVERWNSESMALYAALQRIAETIRANERTLREVADGHAQAIAAAGAQ